MRSCRDSINCYQPSSTVGFVTVSGTVWARLGEGYQGPSLSPCQVKGACPRLERTAALRRSCGVCFQPTLAINSEKMPKSCWRHASAASTIPAHPTTEFRHVRSASRGRLRTWQGKKMARLRITTRTVSWRRGEQPVVRRAVAAYKAKKRQKGPFRGTTADEILEELKPSPVRWTELAAFVIEKAKGPTRRN